MKVHQFAVIALGLGVSATSMAGAGEKVSVAALGWISGSWISEADGRWTEERWAPPRGGVMLGMSRSGRGHVMREFEFLRIAADPAGAVHYWASPGGATAVPFKLVSSAPNEAVFENPQHDYPVRIAYHRSGSVLTATISGAGGSRPMSWTFRKAPQ